MAGTNNVHMSATDYLRRRNYERTYCHALKNKGDNGTLWINFKRDSGRTFLLTPIYLIT